MSRRDLLKFINNVLIPKTRDFYYIHKRRRNFENLCHQQSLIGGAIFRQWLAKVYQNSLLSQRTAKRVKFLSFSLFSKKNRAKNIYALSHEINCKIARITRITINLCENESPVFRRKKKRTERFAREYDREKSVGSVY